MIITPPHTRTQAPWSRGMSNGNKFGTPGETKVSDLSAFMQ